MRRNVEMQLIVREKFFVAAVAAAAKKERKKENQVGIRGMGTRTHQDAQREANSSGKRHCKLFG